MRLGSLALSAALAAGPALAADLVGHLKFRHPGVNGVSGVEVSDDGARLTAVTDYGWLIEAEIVRDGLAISSLSDLKIEPLKGFDGLPVAARRARDLADAEALAMGPDGTRYVGFERYMSVGSYAEGDARRGFIGNLPGFRSYRDNRQIEAVAVHPDGRLFAFPERPGRWRQFRVFIHAGGRDWSVALGPMEHRGYSIVGADFAEDGTLYLLERKYRPVLGWRNRIRRVDDLSFLRPTILWEGAWNQFYNLEGIAVWDAAPGRRAALVGDNNRLSDGTDVVEIRLTD